MKILVCGGRHFSDRDTLFHALDSVPDVDCVVHGAASGADLIAEEWAKAREIAYRGYPARWRQEGKAAGPKRNQRMLQQEHRPAPDPDCEDCHGAGEFFGHTATCRNRHCALAGGYDDCAGMIPCVCVDPKAPVIKLVVAFPGNRGTAGMVALAKSAGIEVWHP